MEHAIPISFHDVVTTIHKSIPDDIIETINHFIAANFSPYKMESTVKIEEIVKYYDGKESKDWLRKQLPLWCIEELYSKYGWDVMYISPRAGDSCKPYFVFTKK
jgi:hypothetical protein